MVKEYKVVEGTAFDADTPDKVVNLLLRFIQSGERVRLFYGDARTGRDYGEEYWIMGRIGRSTGQVRVPLIINNVRSWGGPAILTGSIVRITVDKRNVYVHPHYQCKVEVKGNTVYLNGSEWGKAKTHEKAVKLAKFVSGESNSKA